MKTGGNWPRHLVKPLLIVTFLVGGALAVALVLVHRSQGDEPSPKLASSTTIPQSAPTAKGWIRGNPTAKTVLVEFADFQCGSCGYASKTLDNLLKKHENDLLIVFKNFPLEGLHRNGLVASQAAEAAGKQGKFWEMYELLFKHQVEWANVPDAQTFLMNYAAELQLDLARFQTDLWDNEIRDKIYRDVLEGQVLQVSQTPTFFLNGTRMPTTKSEAEFQQVIEDAIKKAK
jgi:protein-disulfide isomerase